MVIPILILPLVVQIAAANSLPNWDVTQSCRGAAAAAADPSQDRLKACLDSEQRTRDKLAREWSTFPASDKMKCIRSIQWFQPTYTELASCLEMARDAKRFGSEKATKPMMLR